MVTSKRQRSIRRAFARREPTFGHVPGPAMPRPMLLQLLPKPSDWGSYYVALSEVAVPRSPATLSKTPRRTARNEVSLPARTA